MRSRRINLPYPPSRRWKRRRNLAAVAHGPTSSTLNDGVDRPMLAAASLAKVVADTEMLPRLEAAVRAVNAEPSELP